MTPNTITVVAAVLSGILASIITLFWQSRSEKLKARREIFNTLMAYRFRISLRENVVALNCVQATFYDCPKVQEAWVAFLDAADEKPYIEQKLIDAHIQLLEEIAKVLKYKNIKWKDIKRNYFPTGLGAELDDENNLRKAQLEVAMRNVELSREQSDFAKA